MRWLGLLVLLFAPLQADAAFESEDLPGLCMAKDYDHDYLQASYCLIWASSTKDETEQATAFRERGKALYRAGHFELAIHNLTKTLMIIRDDPESLVYRGSSLVEDNKWRDALRDFDRVADLDQRDGPGRLMKTEALKEMRGSSKALDYLLAGPEIQWFQSDLVFMRAELNSDVGRHLDAARDYGHLIRSDPEEFGHFFSRAVSWRAAGRHEEAIADLKKVLELTDEYDVIFDLLAEQYSVAPDGVRDLDVALDYARQLEDRAGDRPSTHNRLAQVFAHRGEVERALEAYEDMIDLGQGSEYLLRDELVAQGFAAEDLDPDNAAAMRTALRACAETNCILLNNFEDVE